MGYKRIDLRSLVSADQWDFIEAIENNKHFFTSTTIIRGIELKYYTYNKRLLWIAKGLEYIEPELLDWIDNMNEDAVYYDVGASNGPFSIYAALKGKKVVAFEPEAQNYSVLEMNHFLNNNSIKYPIVALNLAISSQSGLGRMNCAHYEGGGHLKILDNNRAVLSNEIFKPVHIQCVVKETLDNVIEKYELPFPEYIKIDVDGSEELVIKGAENTLRDNRLKSIFIELQCPDLGIENHQVTKMISDFGFFLSSAVQVQRYEGLYNCIFNKTLAKA
ncbi:FkbM family methyltransferase [Paenibacillus oleatilyticus]|uniref:FkbM family methyltransferase n=1 Tax=Paenibacillus oleatilyticus TaxID=2594886 RepID=UPI001C2012B5|nr:FkbM family methyltransferase [Paenibacillus oleatilyticus]MBU7317616.1 FkbM family methyltransferase [Paenibacillus oleatilyticus]